MLKFAGTVSGLLKNLNHQGIVNRLDKLSRYTKNNNLRDLVVLNASNVYPADLEGLGISITLESFEYRNKVYEEGRKIYPTEPARQAMYLDLYTHMSSVLDRNDRMTMGAGIECRVPFMDYRLMEMIPAMPSDLLLKGKKGKYLAFNSVAQQLPPEVLQFKKLGFSVPWEKYFAQDETFGEYTRSFGKNGDLSMFENLDTKKIKDGFTHGDTLSNALIRQLYMYKLWAQAYKIT